MRLDAGRLTCVLLAIAIAANVHPASAQQVIVAGPPTAGPIRHLTPTFTISTSGFQESDPVSTFRLQVGTDSGFRRPVILDTTVARADSVIRVRRPLPEGTDLYWRAIARTAAGRDLASTTTGPRMTAPWLTLVFPNEPNGTTLVERQPALAWSGGTVDNPPGPWRYEVAVSNAATRQVVVAQAVADTSFVPPVPLESNTPYRWRVTARLGPADSVTRESMATFVIADTDVPRATLLYQSFPNPFPTPAAPSACIWFDLHRPALVTLEVLDIRGRLVRRLVPGDGIASTLGAGRYGRAPGWTDTGCDPRLAWDGLGADGRIVPAGVYLVRLRAGEQEKVMKVLFRGR